MRSQIAALCRDSYSTLTSGKLVEHVREALCKHHSRQLATAAIDTPKSKFELKLSNKVPLSPHRRLFSTSQFLQQDTAATSQGQTNNLKEDSESAALFNGLDEQFPCLMRNPSKGPEPEYHQVVSGYKKFTYDRPFHFKYNDGVIPSLTVAYETWGELNEDKSNAILLTAGLSASSHAKSHSENSQPGWWEKFIGPGKLC